MPQGPIQKVKPPVFFDHVDDISHGGVSCTDLYLCISGISR